MALPTIVKTVLLHEGPFDETDRFLLRAPAVDYVENLHFHKRGNMQKRAGSALLDTVPNVSGDPFFLHSIKNSLHVLTENGGRSLHEGAWTEVDAVGFVGTKELEVETPPVGGMGHISFDLVGENTVVAYEVRERSTSSTAWGIHQDTPKHVVVQHYNSDGAFVRQSRIENARSPKVLAHPDPSLRDIFAKVFYVRDSDSHLVSQTYQPGATTPLSGSPNDTGLDVATQYGLESHATRNLTGSIFDGAGAYNHTRLGASQDGHARYHIAANTTGANPEFYVCYRELSSDDVRVAKISAGGFLDGFEISVAQLSSSKSHEPFDIAWDLYGGDPRHAYVLRAEFEAAVPGVTRAISRVLIDRIDFSADVPSVVWGSLEVYATTGDDPTSPPVERMNASQFTHGGLAPSLEGVAWMAHDSGPCVGRIPSDPDQDYYFTTRHWNQGLRYGTITTAGAIDLSSKTVPAHRLATRPFWYSNALYAGVQQHIDHSILSRAKTQEGAVGGGYSGVNGALVPRTTALLCFGADGSDNPRPVAYVDAGVSKVTEYAESEFATHVPSARITPAEILLPNRVIVRVEDLSESFNDSAAGSFWFRIGSAESPADALCRIHRIRMGGKAGEQIHSAKFGDGAVIATAIPLWFDGRFFGEVGPIDQPEIITVRDERMMDEAAMNDSRVPQNYKVGAFGAANKWRKLQIVVGYYDTQGNKHRSAPSSVLYVWGFHPDDAQASRVDFVPTGIPEKWQGKSVRIYYTPSLTVVPSDIEYFVEVYASDSPDTDPQLVDTGTVSVDNLNKLHYIDVQLVRYLGATGGSLFAMPPRVSRAIYTAGGELPSEPWPSFTRAVVTSTRMLALDAVNNGKVLVSKSFQDFIAPEYNSLLDINLGDERDLLCIGRMDDKVVIFEANDIHIIYGDGPESDGSGEDFAVQYVSTDVGCKDQESIVECPLGLVFFRQERGFYLLDRQINIRYIGDRVYDLTRGIDVVAAELVSSEGEVRFLCRVTGSQTDVDGLDPSAGQTRPPRPVYGNATPVSDFAMVWNYENDQWSVFSDYPGVASAIYQGEYTRLLPDWTILQERSIDYRDPTVAPRSLVRTPWIPIADSTQGYSRVHRMNVLGRYLSSLAEYSPGVYDACDIQVKVWYDYEEGPDVAPQTKLFKFQDFGFDPFSKRNLRAERLQFTITPAEGRGRCQAVKLEFEEMVPAETFGASYALGQGFEISSIDFEIGVDQRVTRHLPAAVLK
ncbi:MAG TPA: hypothetical protein VNA25_03480 [Phycisphaerae bacterium]|nr:hypothetical protein [Phycisphaerae bacterium]